MTISIGLGISSLLWTPGSAAPAFDPATLTLEGWWRADSGGEYDGAPWAGTASAGGSAGRDLTAGTAPAVGADLNGHPTADFNGTSHVLVQGSALSTFVTGAAGTIIALVNLDAVGGGGAANGEIFADTFQFCTLGTYMSGTAFARASLWDGAQKDVSAAFSTGAWQLVQMKWDSTNLKLRVNGDAWQSVACGALTTLTGTVRVGAIGAFLMNGLLAELMLAPSALSDDDCDDIKSYVNARYGLAL